MARVRPATVEITHRSKRCLVGINNLAPLRDAVHPTYRSTRPAPR